MGLDCTHDAFHGSYSSFNRFRQAVAKAIGGSYPPHKDPMLYPNEQRWYYPDTIPNNEDRMGLTLFFNHSDCDGKFTPEECILVANDLKQLQPHLYNMGLGDGHIKRNGGYLKVLNQFIIGCEHAASQNESLEFL